MADDPVKRSRKPPPTDEPDDDELQGARQIAIYIFIGINLFLFASDTLGRLFKDSDFHVDTVVFGLAIGGLLTLLGLEGFQRLFGGRDDD